MRQYRDGRVERLARNLAKQGVDAAVQTRILDGAEALEARTQKSEKVAWFGAAMTRMDELVDAPTRQAVREGCACCLGGKRHELARAICRDHATLDERLGALGETKLIVGDHAGRLPDGRILVRFFPEGWEHYRCPCLGDVAEPISPTYCLCCGGHVKRHLQTALGCKVLMEFVSSALASGGTEPCRFAATVLEAV